MRGLWLLLVLGPAALGAAAPALRVVQGGSGGRPVLQNGGFETIANGKPASWQAAAQGFQLAAGAGRDGSSALGCEIVSGRAWSGASQTLPLNRTNVAPLLVRGWSKAENVSGSADSDYALYVDLIYTDGQPLWGQTAAFRCGTHDWERREFMIQPEKPVKSLTLHCLFRNHTGKVWFDDVELLEVEAGGGAVLFQGVPVEPPQQAAPREASWSSFFKEPDAREQARRLAGAGDEAAGPSVFLARDVAAQSDFFGFDNGTCPELGLKLEAKCEVREGVFHFDGRLTDTTGRDRAVTLIFAWPCQTDGWHWGDDIRRSRAIQGREDYVNQVSVHCGATGTLSLYPLAAVWNERRGLALALDMAQPAQYRLGCHAGLRVLYLAYDFGLVKDTERVPSGAEFRFVLFPFEPRWGFRAAWQNLTELYPAYFVARTRQQGLWMPFTDVSRVQGWEDFGFRYHEGNNNVPWDDEHGVLSFRYTEPMTWWMPMGKDRPRTPAEATRIRDEMLEGKSEHQRQMAEATRAAAMFDDAGQPCLRFLDTPWCNGAVWSLNPNPFLVPSAALPGATNPAAPGQPNPNAATVHWNDALKERLYGPQAKGRLDGEYLDSLEGYVTADLNFRREHFRHSTVPLTFSTDTRQPALFKGLAVFEFTKWISEDVHRLGQLMFANGVPYRFTFLCPWLDVLGTETDWLPGGKYRPAGLTQMDLWRTLSGAKPYLLLMNTDYDRFAPDLVEKYFQRCLFYGMWPGFFSHNAADNPYWQAPKWYNRDRPLFKRYIPVIRLVAEAGWQPIPGATVSNPHLLVERFGPGASGATYLTLYNDTSQTQEGTLRLEAGPPGPARSLRELLAGQEYQPGPDGLEVSLASHEAKVFEWR